MRRSADDPAADPTSARCGAIGRPGHRGRRRSPPSRDRDGGSRRDCWRCWASSAEPASVPAAAELIGGDEPDAVRLAALDGAGAVRATRRSPAELLARYPRLTAAACSAHRAAVLLGRQAWAARSCERRGRRARSPPRRSPSSELRAGRAARRPGARRPASASTGAASRRRRRRRSSPRSAGSTTTCAPARRRRRGHGHCSSKHCATCHKLFGEGGTVGPDLTHANRERPRLLLVSIVDPGAVIRKEYLELHRRHDRRPRPHRPDRRADAGQRHAGRRARPSGRRSRATRSRRSRNRRSR